MFSTGNFHSDQTVVYSTTIDSLLVTLSNKGKKEFFADYAKHYATVGVFLVNTLKQCYRTLQSLQILDPSFFIDENDSVNYFVELLKVFPYTDSTKAALTDEIKLLKYKLKGPLNSCIERNQPIDVKWNNIFSSIGNVDCFDNSKHLIFSLLSTSELNSNPERNALDSLQALIGQDIMTQEIFNAALTTLDVVDSYRRNINMIPITELMNVVSYQQLAKNKDANHKVTANIPSNEICATLDALKKTENDILIREDNLKLRIKETDEFLAVAYQRVDQ